MKKLINLAILIILLVLMMSLLVKPQDELRVIDNISFGTEEFLSYRAHLGFLNAGKGELTIGKNIEYVNGRPCYKIEVKGYTVGLANLFYDVEDYWGSYLDTTSILPMRFYRHISENKYRKHERVDFLHEEDSALVYRLDKQTKNVKEKVKFHIPQYCQDLVSGYYYFRTLDFDDYTPGDTVSIEGFFDDKIYDFKILYLGTDEVKTKLGKINALVFAPLMEKNKIFDGRNSIKLWLSNDKNRVPLKLKAKMFVGAVEMDIIEAKNLRHPLKTN
ncbi:MAG TPA: DUF3108 domain-containing protein [Cyclobacteriaceae bacterium]